MQNIPLLEFEVHYLHEQKTQPLIFEGLVILDAMITPQHRSPLRRLTAFLRRQASLTSRRPTIASPAAPARAGQLT